MFTKDSGICLLPVEMELMKVAQRLADAACTMHSLASVGKVIQTVTDEARSIIGANYAAARMSLNENWSRIIQAVSASEKYAAWKTHHIPPEGSRLDQLVCWPNQPVRLAEDELAVHPICAELSKTEQHRPPLRGWLAVPLVNREGSNCGLIQLTDKYEGDFTAEDEALLIQLARLASVALENAWLYQSVQVANQALLQRLRLALLQGEISEAFVKNARLPEALQQATEFLVHHLDAAVAQVWIKNGDVLELWARSDLYQRPEKPCSTIPAGEFNLGRIAQSGQPYLTNALRNDPHVHDRSWIEREDLGAFAGCPLRIDDSAEGVVALFGRKPLPTTALDGLTTSARIIAQGIKRKREERVPREQPSLQGGPAPLEMTALLEPAVIVKTLDCVITDWNHGAEKLFGYPRHQAIGQFDTILIPADRTDEYHDCIERVRDGQLVSLPGTFRLHRSGARLEVNVTESPLRDAQGDCVGMVVVVHDVERARQLERQYRHAQRMEAFGLLAAGAAHDFNNFLTIIIGYSETIVREFPAADPIRERLEDIHRAGTQAQSLTRQLLDFTRQEELEAKVLDLNAVISDSEKILRQLIGTNVLLTTAFTTRPHGVKVDPSQVQQILLNLAVNARDAMPQGGRLTIETANVTLDEAYARANPGVRPGSYVMLAVTDTGVGMSAETRARIFELHFTTKSPGKGNGLGLATVAAIVKQYAGHIEAQSALGEGSTFRVYLPAVPQPAGNAAPQSGPTPLRRGQEVVLFVEDEQAVRALSCHVLRSCGYTVLEAANGEEALRLAECYQGTIHLLISDVLMPELDGPQLAERLLRTRPKLKLLFLSGHSDEVVGEADKFSAPFAFLQKPFLPRTLTEKVREVLEDAVEA
jgi:PAS domain S-box-containing protein